MTKELKQIQKENRKLILEIVNITIAASSLKDMVIGIRAVTFVPKLNHVLLALNQLPVKPFQDFGYMLSVFDQAIFYFKGQKGDFDEICDWDLTKETLEEQSEQTQITINKILKQ